MRTRREQVQAHRFVTRRIVSALLAGEPETSELPMRRLALSLFASVLVGAIVFAGVGIYGLLNPGGRRPAENVLILERETGATYLYLQGELHPVLNYTSARLILGQANPATRTMSRKSLRDVPRGRPVGIPGAPAALPDRSALLGLPWSVCTGRPGPTSVTLATHVFVGSGQAGGTALASGEGMLVSAGTDIFLILKDHRLRVRDNAALAAMEWASVQPVPVGGAFLNAVPAGPDLIPAAAPDAGKPASRPVAGQPVTIGQVFRAGSQLYVMLADGLSPVGEVMGRLLLAGGASVTEVSTQQAGQMLVEARLEPSGFPAARPELRATDGRLGMACARYHGPAERSEPRITVEIHPQPGNALAVDQPGRTGVDGVITADRVALPGGHVALVSSLQDIAPGTVYLVTDQGIKHPLPRASADQVLTSLGYGGAKPVPVPASILALIPTGAALDPQAATRFAPVPTVRPPVAPTPSATPNP